MYISNEMYIEREQGINRQRGERHIGQYMQILKLQLSYCDLGYVVMKSVVDPKLFITDPDPTFQ
jgi:hypothetical protein